MNVLIAEDEPYTAELLKDIIEENSDFLVVEIVESIVDAVDYLMKHQHNLHLLFFDIQLADGLSFEIFSHVDIYTPIVFCTAFDDYSMNAIKNNGIDYILKPFTNEEIHKALSKYQRLVSSIKSELPVIFKQETASFQQHFLCQFKERTIIVGLQEIAYFNLENEVTYVHTYENKKYPIFKKLEHVESVINQQQFFRINRQMVVNRKAIQSYEPYFNRRIVLHLSIKTEEKVIVSRLKVSGFKSWLES
jgi:DNA-binding LytR/AlgR family response regulator